MKKILLIYLPSLVFLTAITLSLYWVQSLAEEEEIKPEPTPEVVTGIEFKGIISGADYFSRPDTAQGETEEKLLVPLPYVQDKQEHDATRQQAE